MGMIDDAPYILVVKRLAETGHVVYNGWETAIFGWQFYLGAAFVKLFGYSFTTVRLSTVLLAMVIAFLLQRIMVRAGISERNACAGTLALVVSPLFLMISVTFMSDLPGLFAIVICLYGCLRALQATSERAAIFWMAFAVASNVICGSSRQIAWLGVLVMAPCTLWLLRKYRAVLVAGGAFTVAGWAALFVWMHWFHQQPYTLPEPLLVNPWPLWQPAKQLTHLYLDFPFLLLPIALLFLPELRKDRPIITVAIGALIVADVVLAFHQSRVRSYFPLEPAIGDLVEAHGIYSFSSLQGTAPLFLGTTAQVVLTIVSFGSLAAILSTVLRNGMQGKRTGQPLDAIVPERLSWRHLCFLLAPTLLAYTMLIGPRAAWFILVDRYALIPLVAVLILLVRYYQDNVRDAIPAAGFVLVAFVAVYGIVSTHNMASLYRARVALAAELHSAGVADTAIDNGWEYNFSVELAQAPALNEPRIVLPRDFYRRIQPMPAGLCSTVWINLTPHIHPLYAVSFNPNSCYGPAPFAPIHYSRWFASSPGTLYVVRYTPRISSQPAASLPVPQ
jgi:hypothetical protein